MRIALYGTYNTSNTGPSRVSEGLSSSLSQLGHDVTLFCYGDRSETDRGFDIVRLREAPQSVTDFVRCMREFRSRVDNYDVTHALEETLFPVDVRTVQWTSGEYVRLKYAPEDFGGFRNLLGDVLLNSFARIGAVFSDLVVSTSPLTTSQMRSHWLLEPDEMIPLGISDDFRSPPSETDGDFNILFPGRVTPKKGQQDVLSYLKGHDENIRIVGGIADESYRDEKWEYEGYVSDEELESAYEWADVAVIPSRHENFSLTALEAISKGCILVIRNRCGIARLPQVNESSGVFVFQAPE